MTASPLRADLEELAVLPETFLIVDEDDVVRDEGEACAASSPKLGADHERPLQGHHPQLHDAQPVARDRPP